MCTCTQHVGDKDSPSSHASHLHTIIVCSAAASAGAAAVVCRAAIDIAAAKTSTNTVIEACIGLMSDGAL